LGDAPASTIREVINLAASMSPANSWTPALEGATIRNLYPGRSGLQGILAVELQRCGFTGLGDAPSDVYSTILGDRFDGALAVEALGERYRIEQNYFKLHACCRYSHFALDAVLALRRAHPFEADDVVRLRITTIPFAARMADPGPAGTRRTRCPPRSSWPSSSRSLHPCSARRAPEAWSAPRTPSRR